MDFHLQFKPEPLPKKITYNQSMFLLGSCFTEEIGGLLQKSKFKTTINPHGILFNPLSIAIALRRYVKNEWLRENELFFANDCWNSWEHHSRFSSPDKKNCLEKINKNISEAHIALKNAEWLFITFGTSYMYNIGADKTNAGTDNPSVISAFVRYPYPVANCHKQPKNTFRKSMLTSTEITAEYSILIKELQEFNPKLKIVFTLSPVRHIKDGVVENNLSKARLLDAIHSLTTDKVFYFPAYELVIDDLRDYRFYKEDLVHPNEQAINYVFEKFRDANFDENTKKTFTSVKEILSAKAHKPFFPDTDSHKKFLNDFRERCLKLQNENPFMDFKDEVDYFTSRRGGFK